MGAKALYLLSRRLAVFLLLRLQRELYLPSAVGTDQQSYIFGELDD
jgi:hypothetical protein